MKTKWLLLMALFANALLGTLARAQVFSVNGVGYVNFVVKAGFNLVANPLIAQDNSLGSLFKNFQGGVPPFGPRGFFTLFAAFADNFQITLHAKSDSNDLSITSANLKIAPTLTLFQADLQD